MTTVIYNYHVLATERDFDSSLTLHQMNALERSQYQATLAVSGACKGTKRNKILKELGWETLDRSQIPPQPNQYSLELIFNQNSFYPNFVAAWNQIGAELRSRYTPNDVSQCMGDKETTQHFFLRCPNFTPLRNELNIVNHILVANMYHLSDIEQSHVLLYGHE